MKNFNNHNQICMRKGFGFLEVIITLALSSTLLMSLMTLQTSVFNRVIFNTVRIRYLLPVSVTFMTITTEQFFSDKDKEVWERAIDEPPMHIQLKREKIDQKSALYRFSDLHRYTAVGIWQGGKEEEQISIVGYKAQSVKEKELKDQ